MIRRLLTVVIGLVLILIIAAILIPILLPESFYRDRAQIAASEALGREVTLAGEVRLTIIPNVQITATDVSIANAEGFGDAAFADMAEMRVGVQLWPLLSRNVIIDEFVLVDPAIRLQQQGNRNNWTLGSPAQSADASPASSEGFVRRPGALPFEASLGDIRIRNGFISYESGATRREIRGLDLNIQMPGLDEALDLDGSLAADGEAMTLTAHLGSLRGFFEGDQVAARLTLGGDLIDLSFDGDVLEGESISYAGSADINIPSIRQLAAFAGSPLPPGEGLEGFTLNGPVSGDLGSIRVGTTETPARLRLDQTSGTGRIGADFSGTKPVLSGTLNLPRLNVTPYIPVAPATTARTGGVSPWSEDRIDLSALDMLDANLNLSVGELEIQDVEIADAVLNVELVNSRLEANLSQISLYEGGGSALFVANGRGATPSFRIRSDMESIAALPLLQAAVGFDRLSGIGLVNIDVLMSGNNQAELMRSMDGNGRFGFDNGAIRGVNLAQAIRGIETALTTRRLPEGFGENEETDFSTLAGSFTIQDGVATNNDLLMLSPLLRVEGLGTIDIGQQRQSYRLRPRAVASIQGQGGDRDLRGIVVPIVIGGTFDQPTVGIDFSTLQQNLVQGVVQGIAGGQSPEDAIRNAIGDVLGIGGNSGTSDQGGEETQEPEDPAERLLRGLFGNRGNSGQNTGNEEGDEPDGNNPQ
ncbi:AsmA family protein [Hyphobacterium sp.]|uniref:AsmA family protein n=1 Tax=Hyphobacterium sp. TaxID=2004662 RepID=UPI003BAA3223